MNTKLASLGYEFLPSKYSPELGHTGLRVVISGKPTQRFFDVNKLRLPTFDGRFVHHNQITRHELEPNQTLQVCLGELRLETHRGETLRAFSFGGKLRTAIEMGDLSCELTSDAPIFKLQSSPTDVSNLIVDEIIDLLAEKEIQLSGHENELYARLSQYGAYQLFLACMVSLQTRADSVPANVRGEKYRKLTTNLKRAFKIIQDADGWDGHAPSMEELLSSGGAR